VKKSLQKVFVDVNFLEMSRNLFIAQREGDSVVYNAPYLPNTYVSRSLGEEEMKTALVELLRAMNAVPGEGEGRF
jgi:hypothetical protein